jgi:anti-sigma factor RsiW
MLAGDLSGPGTQHLARYGAQGQRVMKGAMASAREDGKHVQILLGAYLLGGLSAYEEAAVRAHLDGCAQCQAEHEELACIPAWLDLLAKAEPASQLRLVTEAGDDSRAPGDRGGSAGES